MPPEPHAEGLTQPRRTTAARHWIPKAYPGQFTFVMATGIISTSLHNTGATTLSLVMFWIAAVGYVGLMVAVALHWTRRGVASAALRGGGFGLFAFTAGSGVVAARCALAGIGWAALTLTIVTLVSWILLGYWVIGLAVSGAKHGGLSRVDGTWFLLAVATQAVAVSSGAYAGAEHSPAFALVAALAWCVGLLMFVFVAGLMVARLLITPLTADDEVAPYWVFMGAGAISVLGGAEVLNTGSQQTLLDAAVVGSVCMAVWSFATWLIPLLVAMMIWHARRPGAATGFRTPLWAMVFPIGMYGEASRQLGVVRHTEWLDALGTNEAWVALAVWLVVAAGLVLWWVRWVRRVPVDSP